MASVERKRGSLKSAAMRQKGGTNHPHYRQGSEFSGGSYSDCAYNGGFSISLLRQGQLSFSAASWTSLSVTVTACLATVAAGAPGVIVLILSRLSVRNSWRFSSASSLLSPPIVNSSPLMMSNFLLPIWLTLWNLEMSLPVFGSRLCWVVNALMLPSLSVKMLAVAFTDVPMSSTRLMAKPRSVTNLTDSSMFGTTLYIFVPSFLWFVCFG